MLLRNHWVQILGTETFVRLSCKMSQDRMHLMTKESVWLRAQPPKHSGCRQPSGLSANGNLAPRLHGHCSTVCSAHGWSYHSSHMLGSLGKNCTIKPVAGCCSSCVYPWVAKQWQITAPGLTDCYKYTLLPCIAEKLYCQCQKAGQY